MSEFEDVRSTPGYLDLLLTQDRLSFYAPPSDFSLELILEKALSYKSLNYNVMQININNYEMEDLYAELALEISGPPLDDFESAMAWMESRVASRRRENSYFNPVSVNFQFIRPNSHPVLVRMGKIFVRNYCDALRTFVCDRADAQLRKRFLDLLAGLSGIHALTAALMAFGLSFTSAETAATILVALVGAPTKDSICEIWKLRMEELDPKK